MVFLCARFARKSKITQIDCKKGGEIRACPRFSCSHSTLSQKKNKRLLAVYLKTDPMYKFFKIHQKILKISLQLITMVLIYVKRNN